MKQKIEHLKADAMLFLEESKICFPEHTKQLEVTILKLNSILENLQNNEPSEGQTIVFNLCRNDIDYIKEKMYGPKFPKEYLN